MRIFVILFVCLNILYIYCLTYLYNCVYYKNKTYLVELCLLSFQWSFVLELYANSKLLHCGLNLFHKFKYCND